MQCDHSELEVDCDMDETWIMVSNSSITDKRNNASEQ